MDKPKLFVKEGCPWCIDALAFFKSKSIDLEIIDVRKDLQDCQNSLKLVVKQSIPYKMEIT